MERGRVIDFDFVDWDDPDDPAGNVFHIAGADLTPGEVEVVLYSPSDTDVSHSSGKPAVFGETSTGKYIIVVYDLSKEGGIVVVRPRTAYEVPRPL